MKFEHENAATSRVVGCPGRERLGLAGNVAGSLLDRLNIAEILQQRARETGHQIACSFLQGAGDETSVTYRELYLAACAIANQLCSLTRVGDRVILFYPPGIGYISALFGCFLSSRIAIPAYPPALGRSGRNLKRIQRIVADAEPALALCNGSVMSAAQSLFDSLPELRRMQWIDTEQSSVLWPIEFSPVAADQPAFLQYTSGSTGDPKGVMVSHTNLTHNLTLISEAFGHSSKSRGMIWLPPYHDMGLVGGILQPIFAGFPVTLMAPTTFLQRPFVWIKAISDRRATISGGPNSAYELCIQRITEEQKAALDLSCWTTAFNGSEPVHLATLDAFANTFANCGFRRDAFLPCYGLAESTLMVSGFRNSNKTLRVLGCARESLEKGVVEESSSNAKDIVPCGTVGPGTAIQIVDPNSRTRVAGGKIGEIWVCSPSVAAGYWNKPELSKEVFEARLADEEDGPAYLRTGDLGFLHQGELYVTGRIKDLMIVRGLNHYPQDIEAAATDSHPELKSLPACAFSFEQHGEEGVVVAHEVGRHFRSEMVGAVVAAIRSAVMREEELIVHAVALVRPGRLPKTSSGKIQRQLCRSLFLQNQLELVALDLSKAPDRQTPSIDPEALKAQDDVARLKSLEDYLESVISQVARINDPTAFRKNGLLQLGLDSLMIVDLQHCLQQDLGVDLPYRLWLEARDLGEIASEINQRFQLGPESEERTAAAGGPGPSRYPLSYGQKALWFLHQVAPGDSAYNIAVAARIRGPLDCRNFFAAFREVMQRHQSLRVRFVEDAGEPAQEIVEVPDEFGVFQDASGWDEEALAQEIGRLANLPFDLRRDGLLRLHLLKRDSNNHLMVWVTHHIVFDFWSFTVLLPELQACYEARIQNKTSEVPPTAARYDRYVRWQTTLLEGPEGIRLRQYWKNRIPSIPHLALPARRNCPHPNHPHSGTVYRDLSPDLVQHLRHRAAAARLTLNELFLTLFAVLLHRYTGQEEIVLGTPSSGRPEAQFRNLVGYCVNPLLVRASFDPNSSFSSLSIQIREILREAMEHQNFPLALLFEEFQQQRSTDRSSGIQLLFAFQNADRLGPAGAFLLDDSTAKVHWGRIAIEPQPIHGKAAQFELALTVVESGGRIRTSWHYRVDRFDAPTIGQMAAQFDVLLGEALSRPDAAVTELSLLPPKALRSMAEFGTGPQRQYPFNGGLHRLIEEQAVRTPDAAAVCFASHQITYGELNKRANQLARNLRQIGVGTEVIVPVCMERSLELVVALLAILKAGGAYLPLDPGDPPARVAPILDEVNAPVLLTQARFADRFHSTGRPVLCVDEFTGLDLPMEDLPCEITAENMAYVIYTSGSTGVPKGAINHHGGICNRLQWMQEAYRLTHEDCVLQKTPYTFDVSVWEFFWPLIAGARLVLALPGGHKDPSYLADLIRNEAITTLHFVPSMLHAFLEEPTINNCRSLKRVICSGEALLPEHCRRFYERLSADLHNLYGPTEASVDVTYWACPKSPKNQVVPIGKAISNLAVFILDKHFMPVPLGVAGEIFLGGIGLGRGYFQRPDLTAERFVPNPFAQREGERLYRTGDNGRFLEDGTIEYLGRLDHQVKVHGFRIELAEIENCLRAHPAIRDAIVTTRPDHLQDKRLVAYVISGRETPFTAAGLRQHLQSRLPDYMVPTVFVPLEAFPLTSSGKVDRRSLPDPVTDCSEVGTSFVAPRTPTEETLAQIWSEILGRSRVGIRDNFFESGGTSLSMIRVVGRMRDAFGVEVPMARFFEGPTIEQVSEVMLERQTELSGEDELGRLLDELENLSVEEVRRQLQQSRAEDAAQWTKNDEN
jgi:amino acid adenylation domain-containing protein